MNSITLWGGGRWASNYLKSLLRLRSIYTELYIVTSNKRFLDGVCSYPDNPMRIVDKIYAMNNSSVSIIVNGNDDHQGSAEMALEYGHHILCEKPVFSQMSTLSYFLESLRSERLVFWESMLHIYRQCFARIRHVSEICDSINISWYDPDTRIGSHMELKRHDWDLDYVHDVIPHCLTIASALYGSIPPKCIVEVCRTTNDSGRFWVNIGDTNWNVTYTRVGDRRLRLIEGTAINARVFCMDFTNNETAYLQSYEKMDISTGNIAGFISSGSDNPIYLQLLQFLHATRSEYDMIIPWRTNRSVNLYEVKYL